MGKITFVIGGARSGKSRYAVESIEKNGAANAAFIATCQALDEEMARRIALHRSSRPSHWETFDEPRSVAALVEKIGGSFDHILIDCLTLLVTNLMLGGAGEGGVEREIDALVAALRKSRGASVIVSNEVGLGIVPENALARDFRDIAGRVNQQVAQKADEVYFMVAGIPWRIK